MCENELGSYSCICKSGFQKDNATDSCMDIDECDTGNYDCPQFEVCENGFGNYTCVCPTEGFFANETTGECFDVDECENITCVGKFTRCQNEPGRFSCVCKNGFQKGTLTDVCIDIDECADEIHDCNNQTGTTCQNYPSAYLCGKYFRFDRSELVNSDYFAQDDTCNNFSGYYVITTQTINYFKKTGKFWGTEEQKLKRDSTRRAVLID